jgi:hypothetical protein
MNIRKKNMKKIPLVLWIMSLIVFSLLIGCGGGGGGGGGGGTPSSSPPTKAVVTISTLGSPSVTPLVGVQATLHLPVGVTVKATTNAPQTDTNVIVASGSAVPADLVFGLYSAGSRTATAYVVKAAGFSAGEFAIVNCDIAAGASPSASSFSVSDLVVSDSIGALITGLTPSILITFQ